MRRAVAEEVSMSALHGAPDIVQIEGLEMAPYGLAARRLTDGCGPRLVYDAHNAEWVLQDRAWRTDLGRPRLWHGALYSLAQTWKLRRFERRLLGAADATVAVSARDAEALREVAPGAAIAVVPNGVDTDAYRQADPAAVDPALVVFTGKMDFRPNIDAMAWFCREVWPRVRAGRPEARLAIVGRDPAPRVRALAGADVDVTGAVDDVRPHLARAGVVAVPLRVGGGTRLKVLEAMAMGKAIAATDLAVEGLNVRDGAEALLADTGPLLAEAVLRLMSDADLRARLGARARARAEGEYAWSALVPAIEALYGPGAP
jgi:glycosyltransferase involved in cell wall biosynthesis